MATGKTILVLAAMCVASLLIGPASGQNTTSQPNSSSDNTKVNKRDRSASEPTADQAKNNASDRETMRKIRRAVVSDKQLSTYAHNIKIISQGGKVTLKGTVHTEEEKKSIEAKAAEVAGAENVTDEITIKGDSK
ncbi:MAG: BON domain-containing protein [Acidobacteriaceae bacterium]|nr:BON domain-containing protein [Acidobacteriaceae bacterium]